MMCSASRPATPASAPAARVNPRKDEVSPVIAFSVLSASDCWVVGVDLGQASDPTAIAVEHIKGALDPNSEIERHTGTGPLPQTPAERVYVRHLQRLPLGLSYPVQVQAANDLMARRR